MGLLLLRLAAAGVLARQGIAQLAGHGGPTALEWIVGVLVCACAAALLAGFASRCAGAFGSLGSILATRATWQVPASGIPDSTVAELLLLTILLAVVLVGPGAISVDARLFGRRLIEIEPDANR